MLGATLGSALGATLGSALGATLGSALGTGVAVAVGSALAGGLAAGSTAGTSAATGNGAMIETTRRNACTATKNDRTRERRPARWVNMRYDPFPALPACAGQFDDG